MYGPVFQGRRTNPQAGQNPFKGWVSSGIKILKDLTKGNKEAREKPETATLEATFLAELKSDLGLTQATADEERRFKRRKTITNDDVEEEEESECEDDF